MLPAIPEEWKALHCPQKLTQSCLAVCVCDALRVIYRLDPSWQRSFAESTPQI